ncbi:MAG: hypothetical protein WCR67_07840 [Bacilli bacterium]
MKKAITKSIVGACIIAIAIWAYADCFELCYELTFLSNFACGAIILIDGILNFFQKKVPALVYEMVMPCILGVFTTVFMELFSIAHFNFGQQMLFLHSIHPLVVLLIFLVATPKLEIKSRKEYLLRVFISPIPFMGYLLFDLIYFFVNHEFVYGLLEPSDATALVLIPVALGCYLLMSFLSYGVIELKKFTDRHII